MSDHAIFFTVYLSLSFLLGVAVSEAGLRLWSRDWWFVCAPLWILGAVGLALL